LSGTFHDDPLPEDGSPLPPSGFNENMPEMDGSLVQCGRLIPKSWTDGREMKRRLQEMRRMES
jgi:hypothetical protein